MLECRRLVSPFQHGRRSPANAESFHAFEMMPPIFGAMPRHIAGSPMPAHRAPLPACPTRTGTHGSVFRTPMFDRGPIESTAKLVPAPEVPICAACAPRRLAEAMVEITASSFFAGYRP